MSALSQEIKSMLDDSAERFLQDEYGFEKRQAVSASEEGFSKEVWGKFAELGWAAIPVDEAYGGVGGGVSDTLTIMKLFGRALVLEPYVSTVGIAAGALAMSENHALKEKVLSEIVSGSATVALASEEMHSRGNPFFIQTKAEALDSGFSIKGKKQAVAYAEQADYLFITARVSGADGDKSGIGLFLVAGGVEGIKPLGYPTVDGQRAADLEIDVQVDGNALIAEGELATSILQKVMADATIMYCAESVGMQEALLKITVEYTSTRKQFGVPIANFQVLRHRMAEMYIALQAASCQLEMLSEQLKSGQPIDELSLSQLKVQVNRSGRYIADSAVQLHGGIGMTDELVVGHYLKRVMALSVLLGSDDLHLKKIWNAPEESQA